MRNIAILTLPANIIMTNIESLLSLTQIFQWRHGFEAIFIQDQIHTRSKVISFKTLNIAPLGSVHTQMC